ncbi:COP9/signalosome complex subunit 7a [Schizosaccharomyces japonicus yFS275]|uniref:COP9/signalosome complex subunit 7a n=1 Tax=Schizosaccharomyces japonicus (strain yFS275 / FY16936) TaxID=402676 RepID=B6K142_SCHJY|nr:COP9/signalosome complex subunit 7a [Schizosaccharomyces japonicus yFS275]EEB07663.1 COP9/signalosome complex subunit 7a [Schizosaccharomyces japonicus yFS275]
MEQEIEQQISDPEIFNFDDLWVKCLQALRKKVSISEAALSRLKLFREGNMGLLHETKGIGELEPGCIEKLRLLTLLDIAIAKTGNYLTYEDICQHLKLEIKGNENDFRVYTVEKYILKAMGLDLLDGKLDTPSQRFYVTFAAERRMDEARLLEMQRTLDRFIEKCMNVLDEQGIGSKRATPAEDIPDPADKRVRANEMDS